MACTAERWWRDRCASGTDGGQKYNKIRYPWLQRERLNAICTLMSFTPFVAVIHLSLPEHMFWPFSQHNIANKASWLERQCLPDCMSDTIAEDCAWWLYRLYKSVAIVRAKSVQNISETACRDFTEPNCLGCQKIFFNYHGDERRV